MAKNSIKMVVKVFPEDKQNFQFKCVKDTRDELKEMFVPGVLKGYEKNNAAPGSARVEMKMYKGGKMIERDEAEIIVNEDLESLQIV